MGPQNTILSRRPTIPTIIDIKGKEPWVILSNKEVHRLHDGGSLSFATPRLLAESVEMAKRNEE